MSLTAVRRTRDGSNPSRSHRPCPASAPGARARRRVN